MPIPWGIPSSSLRNSFYGPGVNNWNINLAKTTKLTERMNFQLRFEVYNVFNHVRFPTPNADPTSSSFGKVNPTEENNARVVQMALKLYF